VRVRRFALLLPDGGDLVQVVCTRAVERGVLALPGTVFLPNGCKTAFVRAVFTPEEVDEALKRLRDKVLAVRAAGAVQRVGTKSTQTYILQSSSSRVV
jgi:hypothetical protein